MKASAIAISGAAQINLEPENDFEKMILEEFAKNQEPIVLHKNIKFFETMGNYMRGTDGGSGISLVRGLEKEKA